MQRHKDYVESNECIKDVFTWVYIDKIFTKDELQGKFDKDLDFQIVYDLLIEFEYIEEVEYKREIKDFRKVIIKAGRILEQIIYDCDFLIEAMEQAKTTNRYSKVIDAYNIGIAEHTSIEHLIAVKTLINICNRENIFLLDKFDDVKIQLNDIQVDFRFGNEKRVEADLIIRNNRQWIICEVERGTTSLSNMKSKMNKIQTAISSAREKYTGKGFADIVIVAVPNLKALEKTKAKIENWEEDYDWRYGRGEVFRPRTAKILYVNLSSINSKKNKTLKSKIKDFQSEIKKSS